MDGVPDGDDPVGRAERVVNEPHAMREPTGRRLERNVETVPSSRSSRFSRRPTGG